MPRFKQELRDALPGLWRYAFALTRDRSRADDLVQDCAERALRKRHLWQEDRPIRPWLAKMVLNIHRNTIARTKGKTFVDYTEMEPLQYAAPSSEQGLIVRDMLRRVQDLPVEQRDTLLLVVIDGLSYAETADVLDVPIGTVMSRLSRARAALKGDPEPAGAMVRLRSVT